MEHLNKKYLIISAGVFFIVLIGWVYLLVVPAKKLENVPPAGFVLDPFNMSYEVAGEEFVLKDGFAEHEIEVDSATKSKLNMFGVPAYGDLDGDGDTDAAVLLESDAGGSGMFYYASLVINEGQNSHSTEVMFLGDRIAPQTVEIHEGRAVYNIMERRAGESMATPPSIGKSIWIHYDAKRNQIGEWVKDFEGEVGYSPVNDSSSSKIELYPGTEVDLSNQSLAEVPRDIFTDTTIETLDLSNNQLRSSLPAEIRHLLGLRELNLSNNNFTGVPAEVGQLIGLEVLDLSNNPITGLPHELGNLVNLKTLNLSGTNYSKVDLEVIKEGLPESVDIIY
ncbi:MAG: leucine-rich repeat domain-containing protein [Candidatus Paceibacterota bacterium]